MTEVMVITKKQWVNLTIGVGNDCLHEVLIRADILRSAMTIIEVPDGYKLAVVGEAATYLDHNPFIHENEVVQLPGYRRVVQEVSL